MKTQYIVYVRMTGASGRLIYCTDRAYTDSDKASELCNQMNERHQDDPNFMAYVTGPIPLIEED